MSEKNPSTDNLQAGRELDMLIAEKIMGWKRTGDDDHTKPLHTSDDRTEMVDWERKGPHPRLEGPVDEDGQTPVYYLCACRDNYDGHGISRIKVDLPAYSTDIAEAWKVLEKLEECGLLATVQRFGHFDSWMCFLRLANGFEPCYASALTAPAAICEAARQFIAIGAVQKRSSK